MKNAVDLCVFDAFKLVLTGDPDLLFGLNGQVKFIFMFLEKPMTNHPGALLLIMCRRFTNQLYKLDLLYLPVPLMRQH